MKKILLVGVLVFTMLIGAFAVYADTPDTNSFSLGRGYGHMRGFNQEYGWNWDDEMTVEEREQWINERQEERREYLEERINRALENGIINEQEATEWREHFDQRDEFIEERGFIDGPCHGWSSEGYGPGMMRGYDSGIGNGYDY